MLTRLVGMNNTQQQQIITHTFYNEGGNMHNTFIDSSDVVCIFGGIELDGKICDTGAHISYISQLEGDMVR